MTRKTLGNDGTRRPVRRLAWGNAGRRRSHVSVAEGRRPLAFALVQAMVGAVLVTGLSVAGPVASVASVTEPAASDETSPPDEDGAGTGSESESTPGTEAPGDDKPATGEPGDEGAGAETESTSDAEAAGSDESEATESLEAEAPEGSDPVPAKQEPAFEGGESPEFETLDHLPTFDCGPGAPGILFQAPGASTSTNAEFIDIVTGDSQPEFEFSIADRRVNGTGYNVLDDYVYGWDLTNSEVVQIGADGQVHGLGVPTDLPATGRYIIGDIDENGDYWLIDNSTDTWYQIDMDPNSGTFNTVQDFGPVQGGGINNVAVGADWAYVPGGGDYLYRVMTNDDEDESFLYAFNRTTGQFENRGSLGSLGGNRFGAVYSDPDGFLYASDNGTGEIYRIDVQNATATFFSQGPASSANDGARCHSSPIPVDYGDAPDSYGTTLAADGPRHLIPDYDPETNTAPLMLGSSLDSETDGFPSADADGDDVDNVGDEDGVAAPIVVTDGQETTVSVSATNDTNEDAILAGWIDLDGNGTFDPGEMVTETVPAGSGLDSYDLTFPVGTVEADTYARFRLFPGDTDQADILPTGSAAAGEVEDYPVMVRVLEVEKTSDATADSRAGDTVTYTVTLTNNGTADYTAADPARYLDDLTDVLDDATLDEGSLSADQAGTLDFTDPFISWEGALDAGDSVVITYEVELTGDGDGLVRNVAFVPPCDPADPDCDVVPPECDPPDENGRDPQTGLPCAEHEYELPRLEIDKTADTTELPAVGETVTYTVVATNVGPGDYTSTAPAPVTDDLTEVLDDATFDEDSLTADRAGTLDFSDLIVSWEGVLLAGESVTLEYTVTYTGEGDQLLTNEACVPEDEVAPGAEPCDSIQIPGALIVDGKEVDPASGTPVTAGEELTYTVTFTNEGKAAGTVDKVDDLSHILDDADLISGPTASDAALAVAGPDADGRISITGELDPDQTETVTYTVHVRESGDRGDDVLANFLLDPDEEPPPEPECEPADDELPDCTRNPVGEIEPSKSVNPESGTEVAAGEELTYTVTFGNVGQGAGDVDYTDHAADVFDDAELIDGPTVSDSALTASGPDGSGQIHITGTVDAGETATVTYIVRVKDHDDQGNNHLGNFVTVTGEDPPEECLDTNPLCTENPIEPPPPGALPSTGISLGTASLAGVGLAMLLAGLVLAAAARRNRALATGERSVMLDELL